MNKKLRLLVTTRCPNKCPMCCNNSWDFSKLPVLISSIRYLESMQGSNPSKIYLYTADCSYNMINTMTYLDGVVLTPHNKLALEYFIKSNLYFLKYPLRVKNKSLRLNLFPDMKALLPKDIDLSLWKVKDMEIAQFLKVRILEG